MYVVCKKGKTLTEEHKAKISVAKKGETHTEETRALMSTAQKGNTNSLGHIPTEEAKALMSKNHADFGDKKNPMYNGGKKVASKRHNAKRRRQFGFNLLMPLAKSEVGHHITNEYIIGMSADVHKSIGGSRKKHRTKVLQWLKVNDKKKYNLVLCVLAKQPLGNSSKRRSLNFKNSVQVK